MVLRGAVRQPYNQHALAWLCIQALALVFFTGGCRTWVAEPRGAAAVPPAQQEGPIRVTRADNSTVILFDVVVSGDSLMGFIKGDSSKRLAIPLTEVSKMEKRQLPRAVVFAQYYFVIVGTVGLVALAWALR
jgi:hypothetical protein